MNQPAQSGLDKLDGPRARAGDQDVERLALNFVRAYDEAHDADCLEEIETLLMVRNFQASDCFAQLLTAARRQLKRGEA